MDVKRLNERLVEIDRCVRVERGPVMKTAIASAETLSDEVTASHYAIGKPDKLGKPIVEGEEFAYLDWKGAHAWHVYELCVEEWAGPEPQWRRRGYYADESEAMAAAGALATTKGAV